MLIPGRLHNRPNAKYSTHVTSMYCPGQACMGSSNVQCHAHGGLSYQKHFTKNHQRMSNENAAVAVYLTSRLVYSASVNLNGMTAANKVANV